MTFRYQHGVSIDPTTLISDAATIQAYTTSLSWGGLLRFCQSRVQTNTTAIKLVSVHVYNRNLSTEMGDCRQLNLIPIKCEYHKCLRLRLVTPCYVTDTYNMQTALETEHLIIRHYYGQTIWQKLNVNIFVFIHFRGQNKTTFNFHPQTVQLEFDPTIHACYFRHRACMSFCTFIL